MHHNTAYVNGESVAKVFQGALRNMHWNIQIIYVPKFVTYVSVKVVYIERHAEQI